MEQKTAGFRRMVVAALGTTTVLQCVGQVPASHAAALPVSTTRTFNGTTIETQHGPVGVSIRVKNKKIVKAGASIAPNQDGRSPFLQRRAVPILKQETLKAQSARIDTVSGATETSEAFISSLQSAIKKAQKAKSLK